MTWTMWGIVVLVCLIIEAFTVDFTFLMLGGGALASAIVASFSDQLAFQIIAFGIVSFILIMFARPWAKKHVNTTGAVASNVYSEVGKKGVALTDIDENSGRVKIGGDVWSAQCMGKTIPEGARVIIDRIDGAIAIVKKDLSAE